MARAATLLPVSSEDDGNVIYFMAGNPEVHRILQSWGIPDTEVFRDVSVQFKVSCILADLVVQSASHYYESDITRKVADDHVALYHHGIAVFAVNSHVGDFYADREASAAGGRP